MPPSEITAVDTAHAADDWDGFLQKVLRAFDCTTGTLHRFDERDQHLKLTAQSGIPDVLMPVIQSIPLGKGIAGVAAERREAVEMCNLQTDSTGVARPEARKTLVQGSVAVPAMDGDRLCGTIGIGKLVPYEFTDQEKGQLTRIAGAIASALVAKDG